jgi:hypothetical protein
MTAMLELLACQVSQKAVSWFDSYLGKTYTNHKLSFFWNKDSRQFSIKIIIHVNYGMSQVSPHGRKSHSRYFILFSDMLMYCKMRCCPLTGPNSLRCCCILPLKKCRVDEILSKGMFKITCQNEVLILCSATAEEGDAWISALRKAVKQVSYCTAKMVRSWCIQTHCSEIHMFYF